MKIRETVTLCEKNSMCECIYCVRERNVLKKIPDISDELAERYGMIADNWHNRLYKKEVYPPINNEEA